MNTQLDPWLSVQYVPQVNTDRMRLDITGFIDFFGELIYNTD